ncbi:hypothetical protein Pint_06117 [Pistacia integerrima]|uniref:Uncharacterized protein n=1 Tax=Pistacia integerrima TaxID=434235 RepID=A0ACC0Z530_9ROSI|nr:hypothetical protein Pint_06117 [Pistacia integerrima]
MNKTPPPLPPNPNQESTEPQLFRTLTEILTKDTTPLESLTPHIQHLTQPLFLSLLSSKTLAQRPNTLLSFFKWAQSHLPPSLIKSPLPLLSLLPSLFQYHKHSDAKSLLVSFINSDHQHVLHSYIVNPSNWDPKKYGIKLSKPLFDTCISAYVESGKPHLAAQIFNKMKRLNVQPRLLTCNVLVNGLVRHPSSHSILLANKVFKDMTCVLGVKPNTSTINVLIYGCCLENKKGQVEQAFQFHNNMVENSFKPDVFTCNILLGGLCREGMLEKALKLFNTWISKGRTIDAVTYNTMISSLCKEGRFKDAFDLLSEMEEKKLGPDHYTFNIIHGALTDAGRLQEAEDFKSKMVEEGKVKDLRQSVVTTETSEGFDSSSIAYSEQINELCRKGKYKDAMHIFEETTQKANLSWALHNSIKREQFDIDSAAIEHRSDSNCWFAGNPPSEVGWVGFVQGP